MDSKPTIPAIKSVNGFATKAYIDSQVALAKVFGTLTYKIATPEDNIVGVMVLTVDNIGQNVTKIFQVIRPNFQMFISDIENDVKNFLNLAGWRPDFLLGTVIAGGSSGSGGGGGGNQGGGSSGGGGGITTMPNLQQVTDVGNVTTNDIEITNSGHGLILRTGNRRARVTLTDDGFGNLQLTLTEL